MARATSRTMVITIPVTTTTIPVTTVVVMKISVVSIPSAIARKRRGRQKAPRHHQTHQKQNPDENQFFFHVVIPPSSLSI